MKHLDKFIKSLYLEGAVKELSQNLNQKKDSFAFTTAAGTILLDNDEEAQVQVIVTRNKLDFLADFETVGYSETQKQKKQ